MRKLIFLLIACSLFMACNNDKPKYDRDRNADYREKDDYNNKDEQTDDKSRKDEDSNNDDFKSEDGWTEKDKSKFLEDCMNGFGEKQDIGKKICPCALNKYEKKYASLSEANRAGEGEAKKMRKECAEEMNNDTDNSDNDGNDKGSNDNEKNKSDDASSGWPESDKKDFVTNCVSEAEKKGMEYLDAQSYCDCMQYKLEKLYPSINDSRLKSLNLESPSIKRMIKSCLPGN
jgi:hypothetical protein